MQEQTVLRRWWNGLRPYQRELTWTGVFGLTGLALFTLGLLLVILFWPGALETGTGLGVAIVAGSVVGLVASLGGMLLGYRIEDRHRLTCADRRDGIR
ncbi:hypothetical protein [Amycolatopsis sp. NPDC004079]|uniref:hypothetical protein n=1 Tax=Amycolatopsis sp. NPDC004079 TaxID=3154549 RepID=UPI0033B6049A